MSSAPMSVNSARLRRDLTDLSEIGRASSGGIDRTAFSDADSRARLWYRDRCAEAGLELRTDGLGNMFVRTPGGDPTAAAVWTGSHLDTVPDGGPLDGALGAVAALECVRRLTEEDVDLARPVQAVVFSDEEGNYGHLLGSHGITDGFAHDELAALRGRDGDRVLDAVSAFRWAEGAPTGTKVEPSTVYAFVELHIEQGPKLEAAGVDLGVVTSIVGLGGGTVRFLGRADHAGTTPMTRRQDALLAAAAFMVELPQLAAATSPDAVITCGRIAVEPGGANVVPGRALVTLDFRDPDAARLSALRDAICAAADSAAAPYGLAVEWEPMPLVPPVRLDPGVQEAIRQAADALGLSQAALPSGAGHDSQNLARITPTGMIFVPSVDGRSHCPAERTEWADIDNGANTLLGTVLSLARR